MKSIVASSLVLATLMAAPAAHALDVHDAAVAGFIDQMVKEHHFRRSKLDSLFANVEIDPRIIGAVERPAELLPWYRYRRIFVTPVRIAAGRIFLATQSAALAEAHRRYGVQPEIVVALVGMESFYGAHEGSYSALTALATLAFAYPPREAFFRRELSDYLILCRDNHFDPTAVQGSYAGALGASQFMPSSYLAYAVDADGGGSNLFADWKDIVASIANYLASHGWRANQPVAAPAALPEGLDANAYAGHELTAGALRSAGIVFDAPVGATAPTTLVAVQNKAGTEKYWVGLPNFLVLMTYNHSAVYALAASQLAEAMGATTSPAAAAESLAGGSR